MNRIKGIAVELLSLFVDDGRLAAAIVVWLCAVGWLAPHLGLPRPWQAPLWCLGLLALLLESVHRRARRR